MNAWRNDGTHTLSLSLKERKKQTKKQRNLDLINGDLKYKIINLKKKMLFVQLHTYIIQYIHTINSHTHIYIIYISINKHIDRYIHTYKHLFL